MRELHKACPSVLESAYGMSATDTLEDIQEDVSLEEMWKEDLRCQSRHTDPLNRICTELATHIVSYECTVETKPVCTEAARYQTVLIHSSVPYICDDCGAPLKECWHEPIPI
jgi:hypothetical protein